MDEADLAVFGFSCTYERSKIALCPPAVNYYPDYFYTRYPLETTKMWNLVKLLTPISWTWTFTAIISIVMVLKYFTLSGTVLGYNTSMQDITLVPFR